MGVARAIVCPFASFLKEGKVKVNRIAEVKVETPQKKNIKEFIREILLITLLSNFYSNKIK